MAEFLGAAAQLVDLQSWLGVLLNASLKGGLILALALAALHLHRRSPASVRHWIGATAICSLLLLPVASALLPSWDVPLISRPSAFDEREPWAGPGQGAHKRVHGTSTPNPPRPRLSFQAPLDPIQSPSGHPTQKDSQISTSLLVDPSAQGRRALPQGILAGGAWLAENWLLAALLVWLAGMSLLSARLAIAMLYVSWLVKRCCLAPHSRWQGVARQMAREMGIRRQVRLLFSPRLQVALSVGLWKPVVVLPASAQTWSAGRMRSILLHELAHVRRWDNLVNLASQTVCALYWFNPLVWWLNRQVMVNREQACDDAVLQIGTRASEYAGHLLEVATASLPVRRSLWRPVEVSHASALKDRLQAILDRKLSRAPLGQNALAVSLVSILLLAPLAAFRPWADPASSANELRADESDSVPAKRKHQRWDDSRQSEGFRPQPARLPSAASAKSALAQPLRRDLRASESASRIRGLPPRSILAQSVSGRLLQPEGMERAGLERFFGPPVAPSRLPLAGPRLRRRQAASVQFGARGNDFEGSEGRSDSGSPGDTGGTAVPGRILERRDEPNPDDPQDPQPPADPDPDPDPEPEPVPEKILVLRSLGTLGGSVSQGLAINKSGQVAGFSTTKSGEMRPFFWDPAAGMADLGTLGGHGGSYCGLECWEESLSARAIDINESGEVIGISATAEGEFHAFFWSEKDGMIDLGTLGGGFSRALDLNQSGQVTGYSTDSAGRYHAFYWSRESGMIDLSRPDHLESWGAALNDFGQVVGTVDGHAFLWTAEAGMHRLTDDSVFSQAVDINNQGQISGQAAFVRNRVVAFLWDPDTGVRPLGTLGEEFQASYALSVNEAGQVVGRSLLVRDLALGDIIARTFFWSHETGMVDVDSFGSAPALDVDVGTFGPVLNNAGQIAGRRATDPESQSIRGYLWSPEGVVELGKVEEPFDLSWPSALNDEGAIAGVSLSEQAGLLASDSEYHAVVWQLVSPRQDTGLSMLEDAARQLERESGSLAPSRKAVRQD